MLFSLSFEVVTDIALILLLLKIADMYLIVLMCNLKMILILYAGVVNHFPFYLDYYPEYNCSFEISLFKKEIVTHYMLTSSVECRYNVRGLTGSDSRQRVEI